jgi:hypothetical protein
MDHNRDDATEHGAGDASDPSIRFNSTTANWDTGNDTGEGFDGLLELDQPNSTTLNKRVSWEVVYTNVNGAVIANAGNGILQNTGATDGLKISGTNNLTAGHVRILGLA